MKASWMVAAGLCLAAALAFAPVSADAQEDEGLKVGDAAPDFSLVGSDGETYTLSQFKGEKPVILAFFPMAFTPG